MNTNETNPANPPTPSTESIGGVLAGLRRRQRAVSAVRWMVKGVLAGAIVACAAAAVVWAVTGAPTGPLVMTAVGALAVVALLGAVIGLLMPVDDLNLARAMDKAASSEDRFASAVQLAGHRQQTRARLILEDALARVRGTRAAAALPLRVPRYARWIPAPMAVLAVLLALLPQARLQAVTPAEAEISAEEWSTLHEDFKKELAQLPKAQTPEEEELQKKLEELAALLKEKPEKKDALKEIARLSDRVEQRRKALGARTASARSAAKAISSSEALKQFAAKLQQGAYSDAASELSKTSKELKEGDKAPDANEFEAMAADLARLADQLGEEKELAQACRNASNAANSMNKKALSDALKKLAEQMKKDCDRMGQCDRLGQCSSLLDELRRRMNQCKGGCKDGQCQGNGLCQNPGSGAKKGGLKAGWGSAAKWDGGSIKKSDEQRNPDLADIQERPGVSTTFQVVSPDEKAKSALKYEELYAEFVQKSEADLDLESVPVAYREYLRRYFQAIRPPETAPAAPSEKDSGAQPEKAPPAP